MAPSTLSPLTHLDTKAELAELDVALRRIGPSMARVAAETAGAFLCTKAYLGMAWSPIPRLNDLGVLRCSQKNMGEKTSMVCNLAVDKSEWTRLVGQDGGEDFAVDAFCEMANCICGGLIADVGFTEEFGYLIPCVPYAGHAKTPASARSYRGAFRVGSAWVHFAVTVYQAENAASAKEMMVA